MTKTLMNWLAVAGCSIAGSSLCSAEGERDYRFDGSISRPVLENYLSRAVTHMGLCSSGADPTTQNVDDDIRMLLDIGAKFVGRTSFVWDLPGGLPAEEEKHFRKVKDVAAKVHKADPEMILQACVFEAVFPGAKKIPVPDWDMGQKETIC